MPFSVKKGVVKEFCAESYRARYSDLKSLDQDELREHWKIYGLKENRNASNINSKSELFRRILAGKPRLLEIGPFDKPTLEEFKEQGASVHYADFLDTEQLKTRAQGIPERNPDNVPCIRHVLSNGYPVLTDEQRYSGAVSHHCVEHQPDLVQHIHDVFSILDSNGLYLFTVPNKELCFDHYIPQSTYLDIVVAHLEQRQKPQLRSVIEHRCFTRHDYENQKDPFQHPSVVSRESIDAAALEYSRSPYVDVHCWQFTPWSFKKCMRALDILGFLPSKACRVFCLNSEFAVLISNNKKTHRFVH